LEEEAPEAAAPESARRLQGQQIDSGAKDSEVNIEDFADVSEERASIISIVKDLEGQVETAYQLKELLEAELDAAQKKLSEESTARAQFEAQVEPLKAQTALVDQLREDISFAEEERDKSANLVAEIKPQLEEVTRERDSLAKQAAFVEAQFREFGGEKVALEAQVMNLKDKLADLDHLRSELDETMEARKNLDGQVQDLSDRLKNAEKSNGAFKKKLAKAQGQVENLEEQLMNTDSRVAEVRAQFEELQAGNKDLMENNTRLENEIKMSNIDHEATMSELKAFKKAMRDIHSEASSTSGRVRQRYFK
jgi:chromosome segregation ATPase